MVGTLKSTLKPKDLYDIIIDWNENVGSLKNTLLNGLENLQFAVKRVDSNELTENLSELSNQSKT